MELCWTTDQSWGREDTRGSLFTQENNAMWSEKFYKVMFHLFQSFHDSHKCFYFHLFHSFTKMYEKQTNKWEEIKKEVIQAKRKLS